MKKRLLVFGIVTAVLVFLTLIINLFIRPKGQFIMDYDNLNEKETIKDFNGNSFEVQKGKMYFDIIDSPIIGVGEVRFGGYYGLSEVKIPEEVWIQTGLFPRKFIVTEVDFSSTSTEASFIVPKTVKRIYNCEASGEKLLCNGLPYAYSNNSGIKVAEDNPYFDSRDNCNCIIETKTNKIILASGKNATIPDTVTEIGSFAFWEYNKDILIPSNVKKINSYAFMRSDSTKIHISEGVEDIEELAFVSAGYCSVDLEYLYLPSTLKALYLNSFLGYDYVRSDDTNYYYNGKDLNEFIPDTGISVRKGICFSEGSSIRVWTATPFLRYVLEDGYFTHMNFYSEEAPVGDGHYFHFVDGVITKWA